MEPKVVIPEQQEWDFVDPPPKELFCPMCKNILREPILTECCGSNFCKDCIEPVKTTGRPCPKCDQINFASINDKRTSRRISELDVLCPLKGRGCHWKGEIGSREDHLDPKNENSCEFLDVECTYGCGEDMEKYELAEHLNQFCRRRPYKCVHCGLDGVYETVVNDHNPVCPKYPLHCQNECGQEAIPRADYDQHLAECPEQEVQCQFYHIGCVKKVRRKNLAQHQQEDIYIHLSLQTAFAIQQLSERDQKLEELSHSWEQKYQELTREIKEHRERETKQKEELMSRIDEKDIIINDLRQGIEEMRVKLEESLKNLTDELEEKKANSIKAFQREQLSKIESLENDQKAELSQLKASITDSEQKSAQYLACEIKRVYQDIGEKHADLKNDVTASQREQVRNWNHEHHQMKKQLQELHKKVFVEVEKMQEQFPPKKLEEVTKTMKTMEAKLVLSQKDQTAQIEELKAQMLKLSTLVQNILKDLPSCRTEGSGSEIAVQADVATITNEACGHNMYSMYDNMDPDALALLEKLPIGSIEGVHYDPGAGRVLIDKETPQLEEERISKFQSAYQSITGKKLKIITVSVPPSVSPDAVTTLVHKYNMTYDQCVFTSQEGSVKIVSVSARQIDQARSLLSHDIITSAKQADNINPDALALLEKLPIGSIKGVHYDPSAGKVLIDKETPQLELERITKFQQAYQSITGRKLKIHTVPVPPSASPDAVATLVHQYNVTYDQCVFKQQEGVIKIISVSSRQIDQAKVLLSEDISKVNSEVICLSTGRILTLKKANLVKEEVDIIVNPANERLSHGGGIALALNRASNDQLQKYSNHYVQNRGQVPVGSVAVTEGGGALKCSKIIHAVGPERARHSEAECERLLNRVIREALRNAEKLNASSISFPAISTGIFGVKKELVARCLVDTIMAYRFTKPSPVLSDIRIVIIDEKTYASFAHYFQQKQKAPGAIKKTQKSLIQPAKFKPSHPDTTKPHTSPSTSPPALPNSQIPESSMDKTTEEDTTPLEASQVSTTSANKTQDKKLSLKDIGRIQHLLGSLADHWHVLGSALGFQKATLDQMSVIPADSSVQLGRLLNRWLAGDAHSPTVPMLVNALCGIEGKDDVVQSIMAVYGTPAIQESSTIGGDISQISYPPGLSDVNHGVTSDGTCITPSTTITTSAGGQLSTQSAQMSVDESTHTSATGTKDENQQDVDANQFDTTSAPSSIDYSHSPTTCVAGVVTATPTPSTTMTYSSPPATVSTPPPGLSNPAFSSPVGLNSGRPYSYTSTNGQGGSPQFPFSGTGGQNSQQHTQPGGVQHTQPGGVQHVQHAPSQSISQGNPPQQVASKNVPQGGHPPQHPTPQGMSQGGHPPQQAGFPNMSQEGHSQNPHNAMSHTQGTVGHNLDSITRSQMSNSMHTASGGVYNYQAASGSYHTRTTQPAHSSGWSSQSGTNSMSFSQAVASGGSQGNTFNHGTAVTNQPRPQKQHHHQTENCPICLVDLTDPVRTVCGHYFCKDCLDNSLLFTPYCPTCKTPLQAIVGNQPVGGTMTFKQRRRKLPGYNDCGTIEIHYYIPDGVQSQEHPHPGRKYKGTSRIAYLPDNQEGQEVFQLLRKAFDARLIFTVGTLVTTGESDVVTWNDIHHKTNTHGGQQCYGYPDPTYLQRVKDDLKAKGIVPLDGSTISTV